MFQAQNVSRTSRNHITRKAGTNRGAVYWHFKDTTDLLNAVMQRVTLPPAQTFENIWKDVSNPPLNRIREALRLVLQCVARDARTRQVFKMATQKVEYVDASQAIRLRHLTVRNEFIARVAQGLRLAEADQKLRQRIAMTHATQGLRTMVDGLIQNWLLDTEGFDLITTSELAIDAYLAGLGFAVEPLTSISA